MNESLESAWLASHAWFNRNAADLTPSSKKIDIARVYIFFSINFVYVNLLINLQIFWSDIFSSIIQAERIVFLVNFHDCHASLLSVEALIFNYTVVSRSFEHF